MAEDQQRVRWGRIVLITLAGLAFVAAPFYLASRNSAFGDAHVIASTTLTNIGTSIVLVGIVFFLERGLVKRVSDAAAQSTSRVVEERTAELQTANRELATELADLRAEFHRVAETEGTQRTAPLRNVATDVSFDSVAEALETANDFGALQGGVVAVPLKAPVDAPELVTFDWRYHELRGRTECGPRSTFPRSPSTTSRPETPGAALARRLLRSCGCPTRHRRNCSSNSGRR